MRVLSVDPLSDPRWTELRRLPAAGLFHSPPWMAALKDCYGFVPQAFVVVDEANTARGGVAFCEIDDELGRRIVSLPFSDACDPLLASAAAWPSLKKRLGEYGLPVTLRTLDSSSFLHDDGDLAIGKRARWHTLDVTDPLDMVRTRFSDSTGRAIAKAERAGVVVRPLVGDAGLGDFFRLHVRLRKRKYRLLAQPRTFYAAIAHRFQPTGWYPLGAWHGDHLLAATIYLRWGDTLYYKFNASDADGLALRPNNLLVWAGIRLAKELGLKAVDLGPSDDDQPGLIRFKREFGAAERELRFLKWTPPGTGPERGAELRGTLGEMTRLFTAPAVADGITEEAGAALYRFFA
jgi:hypothetical protein